jgi:flavin reductase (DIM6/NTAB) family NADH-FMN oxidoreductase RutF
MAKQSWKPGNMLYPLPAVMVTCRGKDGKDNIITIGWTGTVCSDPAMTYVSVRKERYSHAMILETGEFVINLTTKKLAKATDFCGVRSGRDVDKFEAMHLTKEEAQVVNVPMIAESPVNIECRVTEVKELGSHDMFLAEVVAVHADEAYMDEKGRFSLTAAEPIAYSHGTYFTLGEQLGTFGYSVKKGKTGKSGSKRPTAKKSSGKNSEKDK